MTTQVIYLIYSLNAFKCCIIIGLSNIKLITLNVGPINQCLVLVFDQSNALHVTNAIFI